MRSPHANLLFWHPMGIAVESFPRSRPERRSFEGERSQAVIKHQSQETSWTLHSTLRKRSRNLRLVRATFPTSCEIYQQQGNRSEFYFVSNLGRRSVSLCRSTVAGGHGLHSPRLRPFRPLA